MQFLGKINRDFSRELIFNASRSSGPGGQNVNKVNSKVELRFNIDKSNVLTEEEKALLKNNLSNYINSRGELLIVSQTERSQLKNKDMCVLKFNFLISKGLYIKKKRRPTIPSKASKVKRLDKKRVHSIKKKLRGNTFKEE
jgi:ribosome-associated protein